jgi:hypothetical protein
MLTGNTTELDQFLRAMEGFFMLRSGLRYRHMINNNNRIQTYVIQHDMGKNAAYYLKNYWKRSLEIMKAKDVQVRSTSYTLWVE